MALSDVLTIVGVLTATIAAVVMGVLIGWNERNASLPDRRRRRPR